MASCRGDTTMELANRTPSTSLERLVLFNLQRAGSFIPSESYAIYPEQPLSGTLIA